MSNNLIPEILLPDLDGSFFSEEKNRNNIYAEIRKIPDFVKKQTIVIQAK